MYIKRIISIALALLLLAGVTLGLAAAGDSSDPLVTKTFADGTWADSVMDMGGMSIDATLSSFTAGSGGSTGSFAVFTAPAGSTVDLTTGGSAVVLSGAATLTITKGAVVNITEGVEFAGGAMAQNTRYMAVEDSAAVVTFTEAGSVAVDDHAVFTEGSGAVSGFTDVRAGQWFYDYVSYATGLSFIQGYGDGTFRPENTMTVAEAVTLAARAHQRYTTGQVTLADASDGSPWYSTYVTYCQTNGLTSGAWADYNAKITRGEFITLFYNIMPASEYAVKNQIADGAIPDVPATDPLAAQIYSFYRAGILAGYTSTAGFAEHAFGQSTSITRSGVAAVIARMFDATLRESFTIG